MKEFSKYFDKVIYIDGQNTDDEIKVGRFLDINKTNIWKAEQVKMLGVYFSKGIIKNGDRFIFADGWHFGITALKYMAQLNKIDVKIYSYWHAGTYDPHDFIAQAGLGQWACANELGWMNACDYVFVATEFHKNLILDYFASIKKDKIQVVGFPMDWMKEIKQRVKKIPRYKEDLIVFPHRLDIEKCPDMFDKLAKQFPEYKFVKTIEVTKNKTDYYNLIKNAKIVFSASLQETYGIGTIESMLMGAIPVLPNRLSYTELYYRTFLYNNMHEAKKMIKNFMENYDDKDIEYLRDKNSKRIIKQSKESIKKMAKVMLQ